MNNKNKKQKKLTILFFAIGLILYLVGFILLFSSTLSTTNIGKTIFNKLYLNSTSLQIMKIIGAVLFFIGFIVFMIAIILLYKSNEIKESNVNLIIEGKADVITLIFMVYIMIFMLVICLAANELIGALLFGITIIIQSILNSVLIKYYSKKR